MAMRKFRLLVLLQIMMCCLLQHATAQVIVVPEVPAAGVIMKQQIWSFMANNLTGTQQQVNVAISVVDLQTSQPLLEASSNLVILPTGVRRITFKDLSPVSYSFMASGFSGDQQLNQPLPVGEYQICYRIISSVNKRDQLASECMKVVAEPLSPPQLVLPAHESVVMDKRPMLSWTPPAPIYMFNSLSYSVIVTPLLAKQSPEEAIQRNIPVMTTFATNTSIPYTASFTDLVPGKTYAWQVAAMDGGRFGGKSEVWTFTVMPDSVRQIISSASFTRIEQQQGNVSIMHQGILKMEYVNRSADSIVSVFIRKKGGGKKGYQFDVRVQSGQNFIEYNLNGKLRLEDNEIYELELLNSRKEKWYLKFQSKKYF